MGQLQVDGTPKLSQFWPEGTSDGDTARVVVRRITFDGKVTRAREGAQARGRTSKVVIDEQRAITVRFQGSNAPELHYMPPVAKAKAKKQNANFRQHYGRAAARALGKYLHTLGAGALKCRVVTQVSKPNEVFDTRPTPRTFGAVSLPKIFRRLASDWVGNGNTRLRAFLATAPSQDRCYKTDELLEQGLTVAKQYNLAELVANTSVKFKPGELVFQEAPATLVDGEESEGRAVVAPGASAT